MSQKRQRPRYGPEDEAHFLVRGYAGALAPGGDVAPHAHDWAQLIAPEKGVLTVWTAQGSWVAPPGCAVFAPAGVAHGMRATGGARMRFLYFNPEGFKLLPGRCCVVAVSSLLRALVDRAADVGMLDGRVAAHFLIAHLIAHLIAAEIETHPAAPFELRHPRREPFAALAEAIVEEPSREETQAAIAHRLGLSLRALQRGFLAETGLSLGAWRRQARFLHALTRLGAGETVKQAAAAAGYKSESAFVSAFRASFGVTPANYFVYGEKERTVNP
jgi:AraC-like DNA-binding protein